VSEPYNQPQAPPAERRAEPYHGYNPFSFVWVVAQPSLRPFRAPARDFSEQGLSFLHDSALEAGSVLALHLTARRPDSSFVRTARVLHVTPMAGLWLISCQVSPPFSAAELEGLL
jgi:hypothetical protein